MERVAFLHLIGDFVETPRAAENLHTLVDDVSGVHFVNFQLAFADEPTALCVGHVVDGDRTNPHRINVYVLGVWGMKYLSDGMSSRCLQGRFDALQLVVELAGFLVASSHQSVDGCGRETEHTVATDVGNDVDVAHLAVFFALSICAVGD